MASAFCETVLDFCRLARVALTWAAACAHSLQFPFRAKEL